MSKEARFLLHRAAVRYRAVEFVSVKLRTGQGYRSHVHFSNTSRVIIDAHAPQPKAVEHTIFINQRALYSAIPTKREARQRVCEMRPYPRT